MRSSILLAAIAPLAWAVPATNEARAQTDIQKISASIKNIETKIGTLNTTLNGFTKGSPTAIITVLTIEQQTNNLGKAVQAATTTAKAAKMLDESDSATAAIAVLNLEPMIFSLLDNLEAKKPAFDSAILGVGSVSPQVEQSLKQQKADSDAFGKALTAKLQPDYASFAPTIQGQIDAAFTKAIKLFAESGGTFALPAEPTFAQFKAALLKAENGGGLGL